MGWFRKKTPFTIDNVKEIVKKTLGDDISVMQHLNFRDAMEIMVSITPISPAQVEELVKALDVETKKISKKSSVSAEKMMKEKSFLVYIILG